MAFWIYSSENLPNQEYFGKPGYTPEWFMWNGIQLPIVNAGEWMKLPDNFYTLRHRDWRDKSGVREHVSAAELTARLTGRWGSRGVVVLDHEPTKEEKARIAGESKDANLAFRMRVVEEYENAVREREVTGIGRTRPTPYEDECYTLLGLTKPYSVEAMRAQRHPGEAVGEQIVAALERLEQRRKTQTPAVTTTPAVPKQQAPAR
jgi:hypothetical protein